MSKQATNQVGVIYARFSSDNQREESIEAQVRACREYAARKHIEIVEEYVDRAKSAMSDQRPEFQRMIKDSAEGRFNMVIVHKLDRFSRNRYDSAHYKHQLRRNNVALYSVIENLDNSPESIIMESVLEGMAEYYSKNLAREVMKGMKENALKGQHTGGLPPLGYDVDKDSKRLIVNPQEAKAVKLIFSMYLDGCTYGQIIDRLNEQGHSTKVGRQFGNNSLNSILSNPKYAGIYTFSRLTAKNIDGKRNGHAYKDEEEIITVEGAVPALVSKEDFNQVKERMMQRKHKAAQYHAKKTYLLTGKVVCGNCGAAYVGNCRRVRQQPEYITYRCNNRTKRPRCNGWEIRAQVLESMVLSELANIVFNDSLIPKLTDGYRKYLNKQNNDAIVVKDELSQKIATVQKEMDNIISVIAKTASDALVSKLNVLDVQRQELVQQLYKAQAACEVEGLKKEELSRSFKQAREMLKTGQLPTVKALVERYVHKVIVKGEHVEVQFNLDTGNRVFSYSTDGAIQKEIPQPSRQGDAEVFDWSQQVRLATHGGG